jgi:HAD superfamily hydrolase (TIGR01509 family)
LLRPERRPRAVIFDMDGLMLDTERLALAAWREACAALGVPCDVDVAQRMIGRNQADSVAIVLAHYGARFPVQAVMARSATAYEAIVEREGIALKPGLTALLDWLAAEGIVTAVATSTRRARALAKLQRTELLPRFAAIVGGDEVERGKPAPDIFLAAAERIARAPAACVVLEDSEPGLHGAHAAGIAPIMVPDLHPPSPALLALRPLVLASLDRVRDHLASLPR